MPMLSAPSSTATGGAAPAIRPTTGRAARFLRRIRRIDQRVVDDRRPAHVGDAVLCDQLENPGRIDLAQADIDAGRGRNGPGEAPAVAMEHRQRPEIDRMLAEIGGEDVADGVEIGATVMGHHALGIAGRSRGVAERDGVPFVLRQPRDETLVALRQRVLIFDFADPLAARESLVVDIDDEGLFALHQRQRFARSRRKIPDRPG